MESLATKIVSLCSCLACLFDTKDVCKRTPCCKPKKKKHKTIILKLTDIDGVIVECEILRENDK